MNKILPPILGIVTAALAGALVVQSQRHQSDNARAAVALELLEKQVADARAQVAKLQEENEIFKSESAQLRAQRGAKVADAGAGGTLTEEGKVPVPPAPEAKKGKGSEFMKGIAKMFNDPGMKKMMRSQQSQGIRMIYGDLAAELGLTPEETNAVFELLADRQMDISAKALGGLDGDKADLADAAKAQTDYDAKLKELLGDDGLKKLQDYERTTPDRMAIQQFEGKFASAGFALEPEQRRGLLAIMADERLKKPASPLDPGSKDPMKSLEALGSDEAVGQMLNAQRDINARVFARARVVLNPDQMNVLESAQKQQLEFQEMGIKMGRAMFGGDKANAAAPK